MMLTDEQILEGKTQGKEAVERPREWNEELYDAMLAKAPPGWTSAKLYTVAVPHGKSIQPHDHTELVILYYPEGVTSPLILEDELLVFWPEPGRMLVIEPNIRHSVPINESIHTRLSIALKVAY